MVLDPARRSDSLGESCWATSREGATSSQECDDDNEVPTLGLGNSVFGGGADLVGIISRLFIYTSIFERLGTYSGILTEEGDVSTEVREIPTDSTQSIEKLRDALDSEFEVRAYLDEILGEELMNFLDEDTQSDLSNEYMKHSTPPRDAISAAGRAFEDFLRHIGMTLEAKTGTTRVLRE